ncbi:hypothetical protein MBAV_002814 [Candidatus Magnetobacterium bavaricum]|uniref:Uncharacterized protein n=1 Tax=Candidatus Magnetobacterium bavaricum TaxID=29290 RepID=A0A0F3GT26_9BACT|nr:hypothetical protein MBAV_002814 [Candidatus Magnetobacterium bavaricum]
MFIIVFGGMFLFCALSEKVGLKFLISLSERVKETSLNLSCPVFAIYSTHPGSTNVQSPLFNVCPRMVFISPLLL